MDTTTKSAIQFLVPDLRHTLEDEVNVGLQRDGLFTDRENWLERLIAWPARPYDEGPLPDCCAWRNVIQLVHRFAALGFGS